MEQRRRYTAKQWQSFLEDAETRIDNDDNVYSDTNSFTQDLISYMQAFERDNFTELTACLEEYQTAVSDTFFFDTYKHIGERRFKKILSHCKVLVLTANPIEKAILHYRITNKRIFVPEPSYNNLNGEEKEAREKKKQRIIRFFCDDTVFYVFKWHKYLVAHVHQGDTGTNTNMGSNAAVYSALNAFTPNVIISLGVAFGIDYKNQNLGDVIVSKRLFPYSENKRINALIKPNRTQDQTIDRWLHVRLVNAPGFMEHVTYGDILTGGSVLSSFEEKDRICQGYTKADFIVGGEMEGNGLFQIGNPQKIPGVVIKGICDWGVAKNDIFQFDPTREEDFKDSLQAYAMNNAFDQCSRLMMDPEIFSVPKNADVKELKREQGIYRGCIIALVVFLFLVSMIQFYVNIPVLHFPVSEPLLTFLKQNASAEPIVFFLLAVSLQIVLFENSRTWKLIQDNKYYRNFEKEKEEGQKIKENGMDPTVIYEDLGNGFFQESSKKN